jgi:hypothetical protein
MRKLMISLALAATMITTAAHATADGCAIVRKTPDGFLNLRAAPMADAKIVTRLKTGDRLSINSAICKTKGKLSICNEDWVSVDSILRLDGNKSKSLTRGWVNIRFLDFACTDTPAAAASSGRCLLKVDGGTYISGPCKIKLGDDGGANQAGYVNIEANGYFAFVDVEETEEDGASVGTGSWNKYRGTTHAHAHLGELSRKGACWVNDRVRLCAWK